MKYYPRIIILVVLLLSSTGALHAMTWSDCVAAAINKNQSIAAAKEVVYQKKTDTASAVSPVLPQSSTTLNGGEGGVNGLESKNASFSMGARQLIFDGMKSYYDIKTSKIQADAAVYQYLVTESDVRLTLRRAFVRLLSAQENIAIYQKIVKRRQENYDLVKLRYEAGREHRGSLMTSGADLSRAKADLAESLREISLARRQLATAIGQMQPEGLTAEGMLKVSDECRQIPDFELISRNSPLLLQMIELKNAASSGAVASKLSFFPSVYGYFNAGSSKAESGLKGKSWDTGIEMNYPLTDGGERFIQARKADSELRRAEAETRQTRLDVLFTLEEKWSGLQRALDQADVSAQFVEASMERSKIAEAQYSIGQISFNNWTIIEDDLVNAVKSHLAARVSAMNAEAEWIQAKGGTLSDEK
jgi:outer membrane protein TolC